MNRERWYAFSEDLTTRKTRYVAAASLEEARELLKDDPSAGQVGEDGEGWDYRLLLSSGRWVREPDLEIPDLEAGNYV